MKTVFNRALSLVMCLILICSTMSVMAVGADAADDFDYKTYAQNSTKENVHHLLDLVDDILKEQNINETIDLKIKKFNINLTSVDAICNTLDQLRGIVKIANSDLVNMIADLGDLKSINLDVFDEGLSRSKSGDYKIFTEVLELAKANIGIVEKLISGKLDLGVIGSAVKLDIDASKMLREGVVDALFKGKPNYAAAKERALKDFDAFVYTDVIGLVSDEGGILEGIEITADTTVDNLITDAFNILVDKYLIDLVKGASFSFGTLGEEYEKLDTIIQLDGEYSFEGIEFTKDKSVLTQINDVLGKVFAQVVPGFTDWTPGNYKNIGNNTRKLVKYIAENSGLNINTNASDEALMLEILKIVFRAADTNGEKEIYELVKNTKSLTEMANKIVIHLSGKTYPANATYEHVLGDYIIEKIGNTVPLYDVNGKAITAGSGKTVWEVANSALNFFLVDKNIKAYFGKNFTKAQSFFEKLDILLDYTADDGTAAFESEKFIKGLFEDIFTMDLQGFVEATAVKALNFAGKESVVTFLYNTVCNIVNNWAIGGGIDKQTSGHFEAAMKNEGLAKVVKAVITTLSSRAEGTACLAGIVYGAIGDVAEIITKEGKAPSCLETGYAPTKVCAKEGCKSPNFSDSGDKISATGHQETQIVEVTAKCTSDGILRHTCVVCDETRTTAIKKLGHKFTTNKITKQPGCTTTGIRTYYCACGGTKTESIPKKGHKESGYKVTKAATYKAKGQKVNTCTVCKTTLGTQITNMLTLKKATGLKAQPLSTTSIKFSWNKVTGAESYNFYYKTSTGSWKKINAKNKTTVTVKKLKAGTTYQFKVEALAGSNKSTSSTVNATTKPVAVTLSRVNSKKKKEVIVEWKKVAGVTGYEVQYSTAKNFKKGNKTVNIKKQKTVKTIIKKLNSKKKYYVRVRAYKTVNGVKVFGAYSKVKNIKCK